ncbi:MAG: hypothetical protein HY741_20155 [Chloroflexi bacterium]|nr:hypothetical protein [Chloroflexota bacterium]
MTNSTADELARLCAQVQNSELASRAELERALVMLCENAMQQEDYLAALIAALRENAERARALEAQIKTGARAA